MSWDLRDRMRSPLIPGVVGSSKNGDGSWSDDKLVKGDLVIGRGAFSLGFNAKLLDFFFVLPAPFKSWALVD